MTRSSWSRRVVNWTPSRLRHALGVIVPHATGPSGQWCRRVMNEEITTHLLNLDPRQCDAVEISGDWHAQLPWRSYKTLSFPDFDLCRPTPQGRFDVVLCEQVLEHVIDPWSAAKTLYGLCKPGGELVVSTPFLIKIHEEPGDYWRFTPAGLQILLGSAGFERTAASGWGNRACVRGNFRRWLAYKPWHSLSNEVPYPVAVWAFGRRPA